MSLLSFKKFGDLEELKDMLELLLKYNFNSKKFNLPYYLKVILNSYYDLLTYHHQDNSLSDEV